MINVRVRYRDVVEIADDVAGIIQRRRYPPQPFRHVGVDQDNLVAHEQKGVDARA